MTEGTNTMSDDLKAIAARHEQDAPWFNGGLHDPNSYVGMAHKDRGVLLERLRSATPESDGVFCPSCAALAHNAICGPAAS
jgi:hypothetical protein